jgi:hypothetical protein
MKKYLILLAGLGILIAFMRFVITPLTLEVVASDAFLVNSKDEGSPMPISTSLSTIAFNHCNTYLKKELGDKVSVSFPDKPLNIWDPEGGYQYIVTSEFTVDSKTKKYTCQIKYDNGDDQGGIADYENWSIQGFSGLDGL